MILKIYNKLRSLGYKLNLRNIRIIRVLDNKIIKNLKPKYIIINNNKLFLDNNDTLRLSINKDYEKEETNIIKREVKKDNIVFDIGANIGYHTLLLSKLVGSKGKVFAFEPEPSNLKILRKNIEVNNIKNVIVVDKAVSNKTCMERLYVEDYNKAICSLKGEGKSIWVHATTIDDYYKGQVDFVKIDVEGTEEEVIEGMKQTIKRSGKVKILKEIDTGRHENQFEVRG